MNETLSQYKITIQAITQSLKDELKGIRTGRASPGMIENIQIEAYNGTMKLKLLELASITNEGNSALMVMVFDPSTVKDIEKALMASPLGINPQTEGTKIILRIPPLSQEQRIKYAKLVAQLIEESKNKVRFARDEARKKIKRLQDEKTISEDDRYRGEKEIEQVTTSSNDEFHDIKTHKEKEIMEV
ncbi:ribosome recycling factor [soil metagenome]